MSVQTLLGRLGITTLTRRRAERAKRAEALRDGTHMGNLLALEVKHPGVFSRNTPEVRRAIRTAMRADAEAARAARYRPGAVRQVYGVAVPARPKITPKAGVHRPCGSQRSTLSPARLAGLADDGFVCTHPMPEGARCGELYTAGTSHLEDRAPFQELHITHLVCPRGHTMDRRTDGG